MRKSHQTSGCPMVKMKINFKLKLGQITVDSTWEANMNTTASMELDEYNTMRSKHEDDY